MFNAIVFTALGFFIGSKEYRQKLEQVFINGLKNGISNIKNKVGEINEQNINAIESSPTDTKEL